jgi:hypothetical protein
MIRKSDGLAGMPMCTTTRQTQDGNEHQVEPVAAQLHRRLVLAYTPTSRH